jgi:putative salt-induced outer membrane protein YdiY
VTTILVTRIRYALSALAALLAHASVLWAQQPAAALNVALNLILSLKLSHILHYSAEPPIGFDSTDSITAVSLVAKILGPL